MNIWTLHFTSNQSLICQFIEKKKWNEPIRYKNSNDVIESEAPPLDLVNKIETFILSVLTHVFDGQLHPHMPPSTLLNPYPSIRSIPSDIKDRKRQALTHADRTRDTQIQHNIPRTKYTETETLTPHRHWRWQSH